MHQPPIHFFLPSGFEIGLKAVHYSVVALLALEVPYLNGLAQESLQDRLIPASLYGLMVLQPAYTEWAQWLASIMATKAVVDSGQAYADFITDTDVNLCQDKTDGVFTCGHPGPMGSKGFRAYFDPTEQFIAHWNSFHVALAVGYNCPKKACHFCSAPGPDSLDQFMHHLKMQASRHLEAGHGKLPDDICRAGAVHREQPGVLVHQQ